MLQFVRSLAGSLKVRLALASLLLIAGSVALTVALVLQSMERRTQRVVLDSELATVEHSAQVLSARLVVLQKAMRAAAGTVPADHLDDAARLTDFLAREAVLRSLFDTVFVASPDGMLLAVADGKGPRAMRIDISDRAYFRRTRDALRPVISQAGVSRLSGAAMFVLTMPVLARDGRLGAVLVCGMRLRNSPMLDDLTRRASDDHDPVTTIAIDDSGHIIAHPEPGWLMKDASADPRFAGLVAQWRAERQPIDPQGSSRRLGDDIVSVAGVPDADWVVLRSGPADLLLGGPAAGRLQAMRIGAAVAVAGGLVILLVTLRLLRPLRQLELRALRLLEDDLDPGAGWPRSRGELGQLVRVFRHVMAQKAAARATGDRLLEMVRAVMARAPVGIAFIRAGRYELVSQEFCRLFEYEHAQAQGMPSHQLYATPQACAEFEALAAAAFAQGRVCDEERRLVRADGSLIWVHLQGAPVREGDAEAGAIWIFADVTERRRLREQLAWSASHDELTGLVNRREFERRLALAAAAATAGQAAGAGASAAVFMDLDRFKAVNDSGGHAAGDLLLQAIADILRARVRPGDTVARLGGDEFALLLCGCDAATAEHIAAGICARVAAYRLDWGAGEQALRLSVGASIGIVAIDASFADVRAVLVAADAACYEAKRAGRGTVRTWRPPAARTGTA